MNKQRVISQKRKFSLLIFFSSFSSLVDCIGKRQRSLNISGEHCGASWKTRMDNLQKYFNSLLLLYFRFSFSSFHFSSLLLFASVLSFRFFFFPCSSHLLRTLSDFVTRNMVQLFVKSSTERVR